MVVSSSQILYILANGVLLYKLKFMTYESDNIQFMVGGSCCMVAWWPMVKHLVLCKPEAISQMENMTILQYLKGMYWYSPICT